MNKFLLSLTFAFLVFNAKSQTYDNFPFCPPEAVWVHKLDAPWDQFYRVSTYTNDTIISGFQCKKIVQKFIVLYLPTPDNPDTVRSENINLRRSLYWRESNDSVYIFHENQFKLLYDFNPNMGGEILMNRRNNIQPVCDTIEYPELLWDDTLKVVAINPNYEINNVFYKRINYNSIGRWSYGDVIVKIGGTSSLTPCQGIFTYPILDGMGIDENCIQYEECGSLYGYYDPLRGYVGIMNSNMENTFNTVVSVQELIINNDEPLFAFPNPTENTISILGLNKNETYSFKIIDMLGRVLVQCHGSDLQNISTTNLNPGSYFIQIGHKKSVQTVKFEKR